ncbi:MAG: xanthine phosphoribosyltransferase [Eubacteriales bacterium]|nr:xanthine phosphoribosyltransferase [Eubacteriales bacterium]
MDLLKEKIVKEGQVYPGNILKVDCFLNHQIDCTFLREVGKEFHRLFKDEGVNKILTIEASGIAIGTVVAQEFGCPLVFAKKNKTKNIAGNVYSSSVESFTHSTTYNIIVSEKFLNPGDKVLIVDDFLAIGNALKGLIDLVKQSGAELVGCGTVIEKGYQHGGDALREAGIRVESLAIIESMNDETGEIVFRD